MKKTLALLILLTISTTSFGQFWKPKAKPSPTPKPVVVEVVKTNTSSLQEAKNVIKELNTELSSAKASNAELKTKLDSANSRVKDAELNTQQVQKNADALKAWGVEQQDQAFQWMDKYTKAIKRYHRLKNIAAFVGALFGAMLGMYCMRLVPPVYAAYALALPVAGAVLGFTGIWLFL
jgi:VIT1/CCC1 family predicted Fe2+/Mn2+ transporter